MQMIGYASSGAFTDVDADIESLRFRNLPQQFLSTHNQGKKFDNFIFTEITQLARPNVTSAGVATDLTLAAVLRRANPMRT